MTTPRPAPTGPGASNGRPRFGLASTGSRVASFGTAGAAVGAVAVAVLVGGLVWSAATGQAPPAQRPHIFGGSLVLDDYRPLTVIDLATGAVTVQLEGVYAQVGAASYSGVQAVATTAGTMLVNRTTGTFNMLGKDNYVLGPANGGISLGRLAGETGAAGFAYGGATFIVRYAPRSTVSFVDASTVEAGAQALASRSHRPVRPLGFAKLPGLVDDRPGGAVAGAGGLWALESSGGGSSGGNCQLVRLAPSPRASQGLSAKVVSTFPGPCAVAALEAEGPRVGLSLPGRVEIFSGHQDRQGEAAEAVSVAGTAKASQMLPVLGAHGELWFLARLASGWSVFGVDGAGQASAPRALTAFGPRSEPAVPAFSRGRLYTLDQARAGQPKLWVVNPGTGTMRPVAGVPAYPAKSVTEKASFQGAEVLVDGPRVVFNNPGSLLAVVVFTDGTHAPVIVDKSSAVLVSAAGPGDANVKPRQHRPQSRHHQPGPPTHPPVPTTAPPTTLPQPAPQPVTQQASCASTTEKPYQPQIRSVKPADQSALVTWAYHLLDEQDCLPSTWSVTLTALGGAPQPVQPVQAVDGQEQLLVTGLRPGTTYRAVVTAYMDRQSTASVPYRFATTAIGPGAPSSVREVANGRGGWVVSWEPCRTGAACEVPARQWTVTGTSCGSAFVGQPPTLTVPGAQTSVVVDGTGAPGAPGALGESLEFSVQGVSEAGLQGAPAIARRCVRAWQPPDPADLELSAAGTRAGRTVTAELRVVVAQGTSQTVAFGGSPVTFSYTIGDRALGPTTSPEAAFPGLKPAKSYQATVTVTPIGHPSAAATLTSAPFSRTIAWPGNLTMEVAGAAGADANSGTVLATFSGLPTGPFYAQGFIACGSVVLPVSGALAGGQFIAAVDLDQMGGHCQMSLTLNSTLSPDPYGLSSPALTAAFTLGEPPSYSFAATASASCARGCRDVKLYVSFNGPGQPAGTDWQIRAAAAGATAGAGGAARAGAVTGAEAAPGCRLASPAQAVARFPVALVWPIRCPAPKVTVSWVYLGQAGSATARLPGLPRPPAPSSTTTTKARVPTVTTRVPTVTTRVPTTVAPTRVPVPPTAPAATTTSAPAARTSVPAAATTTLAATTTATTARRHRTSTSTPITATTAPATTTACGPDGGPGAGCASTTAPAASTTTCSTAPGPGATACAPASTSSSTTSTTEPITTSTAPTPATTTTTTTTAPTTASTSTTVRATTTTTTLPATTSTTAPGTTTTTGSATSSSTGPASG
ncbi:MAG: hypothetical protein ACRDZX_00535, partial [Acidimicrobiales bacterium]